MEFCDGSLLSLELFFFLLEQVSVSCLSSEQLFVTALERIHHAALLSQLCLQLSDFVLILFDQVKLRLALELGVLIDFSLDLAQNAAFLKFVLNGFKFDASVVALPLSFKAVQLRLCKLRFKRANLLLELLLHLVSL